MIRRFIKFFLSGATILVGLVLVSIAYAGELDLGINEVGEEIALGAGDPRVLLARIIQIALSLLGVVAVSLVLYGGFTWMTAGGDPDKITKARQILINATIGLVIVLSSWAITTFVLSRLMEATGWTPPTPPEVCPPGEVCVGCPPGVVCAGGFAFRVASIIPPPPRPSAEAPRNTQVRIWFTENVEPEANLCDFVTVLPATIDTALCTENDVGDFVTEHGIIRLQGSLITFTPNGSCEPLSADTNCFAVTTYNVNVDATLRSDQNRSLNCTPPLGSETSPCEAEFIVGNYLDLEAPRVNMTLPNNQQSIRQGSVQSLKAKATDDVTVAEVQFFEEGVVDTIGRDQPPPPNDDFVRIFDAEGSWDTSRAESSCPVLHAEAVDNTPRPATRSSDVRVSILPTHCFSPPACGGDPASPDYCGKCEDEACDPGAVACTEFCRSGACIEGFCVGVPRIDEAIQPSAAPGSYVTITGEFFRDEVGGVTFLGNLADPEDDVVASLAPCDSPWSDGSIVVVVPDDAVIGPIQVETIAGSDTTAVNDPARGDVFDFDPTGPLRPGLCGISPNEGQDDAAVTLYGNGFGAGAVGDVVEFSGFRSAVSASAQAITSAWGETQISARVPTGFDPGDTSASVIVAGLESNAVDFTILGPEAGTRPVISSIEPASGPPGTYVTITGSNFGTLGLVYFEDIGPTNSGEARGDASFPDACDIEYWQNNQIVIKVPTKYSEVGPLIVFGPHELKVSRSGTSPADSDPAGFEITDTLLAPGLCRIDPPSAPDVPGGYFPVEFYGEGFVSGLTARFFPEKETSADLVGSILQSTVPEGAQTGPVRIELVTDPPTDPPIISNPLEFGVSDCREEGCVTGECCPNGACQAVCTMESAIAAYGWHFSTGPIPRVPRLLYECAEGLDGSPSPWNGRAGGENVCVNAEITGRFSLAMDADTISSSTVKLYQCDGPDDSCDTNEISASSISNDVPWSDPVGAGSRSGTKFTLIPSVPSLEPNTWYRVTLSTAITADGFGDESLAQGRDCDDGLAYCWRFKTRSAEVNQGVCELGSINVNPAQYTATEDNETIPYETTGQDAGDMCVNIRMAPYNFSWEPNPTSYASVAPGASPDHDHEATATALDEPPSGEVTQVTASVPAPDNLSDFGELTIDFTDPRVVEQWPNCQAACINGEIGMRFNTQMNQTSLTSAGAVVVWECGNEACDWPSDIVAGSVSARVNDAGETDLREFVFTPADADGDGEPDNLDPRKFYRVIVSGNVESASHVQLTDLNRGLNFSWVFRTKDDDKACGVARVEVRPSDGVVSIVGARLPYLATPFGTPDECSASGQRLLASSYSWDWGVEKPAVAQLLLVGGNLINTTTTLPWGCSSMCLHTGSGGRVGEDAVCGNSSNADGSDCNADSDCTISGEICSSFGQCIEARLGEECDDGNSNNGDGCSSICLNEGVREGAICGEGGECVVGYLGRCSGSEAELCSNDTECGTETTEGGEEVEETCVAFCQSPERCVARGHETEEGALGWCVESGEDCDDGKQCSISREACETNDDCPEGQTCGPQSGDGCSAECLNEGANPAYGSTCGNADVSTGEECDDGSPGCSSVCLRTGSHPQPFSLCGNGTVEPGEDCDDGNIEDDDGCSSWCLNEGGECDGEEYCTANGLLAGSSAFYSTPSFCGDGGAPGTGEECEATAAAIADDDNIDPLQVAEAVGEGEVEDGKQTTKITATEANSRVPGEADFTLQCGFTDDDECRDPGTLASAPTLFGVGTNSCCYARPITQNPTPTPDSTGVCRNPLIKVDFDRPMDIGSFTGSVRLAEGDVRDCPDGQESLSLGQSEKPGFVGVWNRLKNFLASFIPFVHAQPPGTVWCTGAVAGTVRGVHTDTGSTLYFEINQALRPETWYKVRIIGDEPGPANEVDGVLNQYGVGMSMGTSNHFDWDFQTGTDICEVDSVEVEDTQADPSLFSQPDEKHDFVATAKTQRLAEFGGGTESITSTTDYSWEWQPWRSSTPIVVIGPPTIDPSDPRRTGVTSQLTNGTAVVSIQLKITGDAALYTAEESTVNETVDGALDTEVFICENPWPGGPGDTNPLRDDVGHFQTRYCLDAGNPADTTDDLPSFSFPPVPIIAPPPGILNEFVLMDPGSNDVIGFRMMANAEHLSPLRWFQERFEGSPQLMQVDGYEAVRDGRTIYVSAPNYVWPAHEFYSNIYIISYNEGASPETRAIYEQLISNLRYQINLNATSNTGRCRNNRTVSCVSDLNCPGITWSQKWCLTLKDKVRRDLRRLADFREIEAALAPLEGSFPQLEGGTFVRSHSVSVWPSWHQTLAQEIGVALPVDPLNQFAECTGDEFTEETCYNAVDNTYQCPRHSRVYQYHSLGPNGYRLETDLEYGWLWQPPSPNRILPTRAGENEVELLAHRSIQACTGMERGEANVCGDGVVGGGELCELGETATRPCTHFSTPDGPPATNPLGLIGDEDGTVQVKCKSNCGRGETEGFELVEGATCELSYCGDGVVQAPNAEGVNEVCDDGDNNGQYGYCKDDCSEAGAYCGDNTLAGTEECDLGGNNGQWNLSDGTAEVPLSCSWNCTFPGPYCGDGEVQEPHEQCDGNILKRKSICSGGTPLLVCDADAGCPEGETCIDVVSAATGICPDTLRCSSDITDTCATEGASCGVGGICTRYEQYRNQGCGVAGNDCARPAVPACRPEGSCGNGFEDGGEECDDGNTDNNDACTNSCRNNICGDGFPWVGVEDCDFGDENGVPCPAAYGMTCDYCSNTCTRATNQGPFCGDSTHTPGAERCDYSAEPIVRDPATAPIGFVLSGAGRSLCNISCNEICPPDYSENSIRFQDPSSSSNTFDPSGEVRRVTVSPFRLGGGLTIDVDIGADVIHFPSPLHVLFLLDDSKSMSLARRQALKTAMCGNSTCASTKRCSENTSVFCVTVGADCTGDNGVCTEYPVTPDSAIAKLYDSRDSGDVSLGIIEFGGISRYRTWNNGAQTDVAAIANDFNCNDPTDVPCYDRAQYLGPDGRPETGDPPQNMDTSGFLADSVSNRDKLRSVVASFAELNNGTRTYLPLKQAQAIFDADTSAGSKVIILMSDGESTDCCSFIARGGRGDCQTSIARSHCRDQMACSGSHLSCGAPDIGNRRRTCEAFDCNEGRLGEEPDFCCSWDQNIACRPSVGADCQFSDMEAAVIHARTDKVYIFTAAIEDVIDPMIRWATTAIGGVKFDYAGGANELVAMFNSIIESIGVQVQISNQQDFTGSGSWVDSMTVPESEFGILFDTPELNDSGPQDDWSDIWMRTIYGGTGPDADIRINNMRWSYCPFADF